MSQHQLFITDTSSEEVWNTYLSSFPEGSNPIFKERTEHDCNCCKQFIRAVGSVVTVIDGRLVSIWDVDAKDPNYQDVADSLSALVKSHVIKAPFFHFERTAGTEKSFMQIEGGVHTWDHFFVNIPQRFVMDMSNIPSAVGEKRSTHDVFLRSLVTITDESIETVIDLIQQNSLYRGEENLFALKEFQKAQTRHKDIINSSPDAMDFVVWEMSLTLPTSVSKIRNTAIGTLLVDLSSDVDLTEAVNSFESKVAPTNYKRPTALVTKKMVDNARKTVESLGLTSALQRRYANLEDLTINNLLFADRSTKAAIVGDVFDQVIGSVGDKTPKNLDKVETVSIDKFIEDVLPTLASIEVMFENRHTNNLVSLIAPSDPTARQLFKWGNNFSWSYNGDVTDSIKERVKKAGGSVEGDLCCRLAWDYTDDLDLHMFEPNDHIYFANRRRLSRNGGMLDVDANGADGPREDPVENIFYADKKRMRPGKYRLAVNNYYRRSGDSGFEVEVEFGGNTYNIQYNQVVRQNQTVDVCVFHVDAKGEIKFESLLPTTQSTKQVWNLPTQRFHKVRAVMMSPNCWDGKVIGNKHFMFMLEGCTNEGQARALYNEFLIDDLLPHRKVIEMIGSKLKTEESANQLSGLGFSSTQRGELLCRVTSNFTRIIRITF